MGDYGIEYNSLIERLKNFEKINNLYLICICEGNALFEIINSLQISKDYFKYKNRTVVGLANGREEAFQLTVDIINGYIHDYPDCDFSTFKKRIV